MITPEIKRRFVVVVLLAILYILSIVWVARDAYMRGTYYWYVWGIVPSSRSSASWRTAYCVRPCCRSTVTSRSSRWPSGSASSLPRRMPTPLPVESDYVLCEYHQRLKNLCGHCAACCEQAWTVCHMLHKPGQRPAPGGSPRPQLGRPASSSAPSIRRPRQAEPLKAKRAVRSDGSFCFSARKFAAFAGLPWMPRRRRVKLLCMRRTFIWDSPVYALAWSASACYLSIIP